MQLQTGVTVAPDRTYVLEDVFALTGYSLLVAGTAEASTCKGPALDQSAFRQRIGRSMSLVDELELAMAATELAKLRDDLPCSVALIGDVELHSIFFSTGLMAAFDGRNDEAIDMFARAAAIKPDVPLDTNYPPNVQQLYLQGKDQTSNQEDVELSLVPPTTSRAMWLDGVQLKTAGPTSVWVKPGTHLVHVETTQGSQRAALLDVAPGGDALWADPRAAGAALTEGLVDGPEGAAANALLLAAAAGWSAPTVYVDTPTGILLYGEQPLARTAVPLAPTGDRLGIRVGGGFMVRGATFRPAPFAYGAPSLELDVALVRGLEIGLTATVALASFTEDTLSVLPVISVGPQWAFPGSRLRPFAGVHFGLAVDGPGAVRVGGLGRLGIRFKPIRDSTLRLAAAANFGWVGAIQAGLTVSVGFGLGGPG
ncbi:MAG: hypothetical protein GY898_09695 [Proteobacteria bacterium]|nr:hypothetical protein [Pseudomonadota bacterium]